MPLALEALGHFRPSPSVSKALFHALGALGGIHSRDAGSEAFLKMLASPPTGEPLTPNEHRQFRRILEWIFDQLTTEAPDA